MKIKICFLLICAALCSFRAYAAEVKVVDGDSLEIGERRIRLDGIDAPEYMQICHNKKGKKYFCGKKSLQYLKNMLKGKKVDCRCLAQKDRYKREICECFADGVSVNAAMVAAGWAITYRDKTYLPQENSAKQNKKGIWQGKFMRPAIYRALNRAKSKTAP